MRARHPLSPSDDWGDGSGGRGRKACPRHEPSIALVVASLLALVSSAGCTAPGPQPDDARPTRPAAEAPLDPPPQEPGDPALAVPASAVEGDAASAVPTSAADEPPATSAPAAEAPETAEGEEETQAPATSAPATDEATASDTAADEPAEDEGDAAPTAGDDDDDGAAASGTSSAAVLHGAGTALAVPGSIPASGRSAAEDRPGTEGTAGGPGFPVHGSLSSAYRARWNGDEDDHDLFEVLSLDLGDRTRHEWTGHVMARANADLDGGEGEPSAFFDLDDTYDGDVTLRLYDAWAERRDLGPLARLRLGRQTIWDTPRFAWFDGASAETEPFGRRALSFGLYGGVPVHVFESSPEGDLLAGAFAQARPWRGGRVRLDWMHADDETSLGDESNDLARATVWQSFGRRLRAEAWYTGLEQDGRDYAARVFWSKPEDDVSIRIAWFELLSTQTHYATEFDPFFTTLFEQYPYRQAQLLASKGFGDHVDVQTGIDVRRVDDDEDVGPFNRDFERAYATVGLTDSLPAGLDLALTGESWDGGGNDVRTWGLDLSRRFGKGSLASLGSYYSLYKTDAFSFEEREHVRTWYARVRWRRSKSTTWDLRYELEDLDDETFHTVRAGLTWRF